MRLIITLSRATRRYPRSRIILSCRHAIVSRIIFSSKSRAEIDGYKASFRTSNLLLLFALFSAILSKHYQDSLSQPTARAISISRSGVSFRGAIASLVISCPRAPVWHSERFPPSRCVTSLIGRRYNVVGYLNGRHGSRDLRMRMPDYIYFWFYWVTIWKAINFYSLYNCNAWFFVFSAYIKFYLWIFMQCNNIFKKRKEIVYI